MKVAKAMNIKIDEIGKGSNVRNLYRLKVVLIVYYSVTRC